MPRPSASQLNNNPTPPPPPLPDPSPFFQAPPPEDPTRPDSHRDGAWLSPQELGNSPSSNSPELSADGPGSASPSDTRSTGDKPPTKALGRAQLRKVAGVAVTALGGMLANLLTQPESVERDLKLWEPDEQDVAAIGEPLAGIAARRVPSGVAGPDTPDVVALVVGLVGYVGKQFAKRQEARAIRAAQSAWQAEHGDPEAEGAA